MAASVCTHPHIRCQYLFMVINLQDLTSDLTYSSISNCTYGQALVGNSNWVHAACLWHDSVAESAGWLASASTVGIDWLRMLTCWARSPIEFFVDAIQGVPQSTVSYIHWIVTLPIVPLIARFMGPTWGPSAADRTQVGPMLAPWTLLSGTAFTYRCLGGGIIFHFLTLCGLPQGWRFNPSSALPFQNQNSSPQSQARSLIAIKWCLYVE